eukprot:g44707.t1
MATLSMYREALICKPLLPGIVTALRLTSFLMDSAARRQGRRVRAALSDFGSDQEAFSFPLMIENALLIMLQCSSESQHKLEEQHLIFRLQHSVELEQHSSSGIIRGTGKLTFRAEYEVLLLQFARGVIVTLEEAQDGHVAQEVGGGVEMVRDWKVLSFVLSRAQVLYKAVSEPPLGLTDVEE